MPRKRSESSSARIESKARIVLVEDHAIVRYGLTELINAEPDLVVSGEAETVSDALRTVVKLKPDLVIVDLTLRQSNGMELIRTLHTQFPQLGILVLSMHDEALNAELALRVGARGYLMKDKAITHLFTAIHRILSGKIYLSEEMTWRMLQHKVGRSDKESPVEQLSARELQVFQMIGRWVPTKQIAQQLHISVKTVEYYRQQIKEKLQLRSGIELTQYATGWFEHKGDA
jgi:DNA-binding NarL/FixJ family response regulator